MSDTASLVALIEAQGGKIRDLKAAKASPDAIKAEVGELLTLKTKYKEVTGSEYVAPGAAAAPAPKKKEAVAAPAPKESAAPSKKSQKKETTAEAVAATTKAVEQLDLNDLVLYSGSAGSSSDVLKCTLVAELFKKDLKVKEAAPTSVAARIPQYPAIVVPSSVSSSGHACKHGTVIFGASAVSRYLAGTHSASAAEVACLDMDEVLSKHLKVLGPTGAAASYSSSLAVVTSVLEKLEADGKLADLPLALHVLYPSLKAALALVVAPLDYLRATVKAVDASALLVAATARASGGAAEPKGKGGKAAKKGSSSAVPAAATTAFTNEDVVRPVLGAIDWASAGLMSSLKIVFDAAVLAAFPQVPEARTGSVITRCSNSAFGDFQCNNAMALSKALKGLDGYVGPVSPKDVAERIIAAIPVNPIVAATSSAPNGFINITLSAATMTGAIAGIIQEGVKPPVLPPQQVLVDFSSPNIAKEMHVGHLRSTIIGDSICRLLEFCGFDVMRVNHVGDWGTQFGMLITYLQEAFPDILTNPPNISDLTVIYKASKKRFDEDDAFKLASRNNVVKLQAHDPACTAIWQLLCTISRAEFQKVYDALDIKLTEVGESFYNPLIPGTIQELEELKLVETDESGMLLLRLPHFTIPLIVRKSDGGYGYDSTDMAALKYRTQTLKRSWLVYITDAGQAPHFHMCFDGARAAGWVPAETHRVDHIGFGVVCGDDGKRFKTRSSETVRLIDLLDAAKDRMKESLRVRGEEGKSALKGEELEAAAKIIGYGAVKYFDLKQNPVSNYIFSYDRMLDTKGDTAVYLLFAYARLASILRKAADERSIDFAPLHQQAQHLLTIEHPAERALAFELLQLGDVIKSVIADLLPNRLCDYLKSLAVAFTDFVTKCHVLNAESAVVMHSRLLLCEATRRVMAQCFQLLGIGTLERI